MTAFAFPQTRVPDPRKAPGVRWGILGPGRIAGTFAEAVANGTASRVVAVGSRSHERASAFAQQWSVARAHGSYEDLVADPEVDAIYVASPHSEHHAHALLALQAGKPVLVEKAFTRNATEAREVLQEGDARGLLVAEAMWSRYLPHYDIASQVVQGGLLGEVVTLTADHSQRLYPDGPQRLSDPELAGGALLDLGVYPISLAHHLLGPAARVQATGTLTDQGVDATSAVLLSHDSAHRVGDTHTGDQRDGGRDDGRAASSLLTASMAAVGECTATVTGTRGRLHFTSRFYHPQQLVFTAAERGATPVVHEATVDPAVRGFSYQIAAFARALAAGQTEPAEMPHAATVSVMETMDEVRAQLGVRYPGEADPEKHT